MKIAMLTWGSYGDVRPFLALAAGLGTAGHEVTLAVTSSDGTDYGPAAARLGVRLLPVPPGAEAGAVSAETGRKIVNETDPVRQTKIILSELFLPAEAGIYSAAEELGRGNDLMIGHYFAYPVRIAAEKAHRPFISVVFNPSFIPTLFAPPAGLPNFGLPVNALFWKRARKILNENLLPFANGLRRRSGMPNAKDMISGVWLSRELNLIAVSRALCPGRPDWADSLQVCGFFNAPGLESGGIVPVELEEFLARGTAPVYLTLGSMGTEDIRERTAIARLFAEAVNRCGCRAVIQLPLREGISLPASEAICYVGSAPHERIFPKCAAVVHHGGAGTTQAALLAGVPSIVIPHLSDQYFYGREMKRLGVAPEILPRKALTEEALAGRIRAVLSTPAMKTRAERIGSVMRKENGVARAVQLIGRRYGA